MLPDGVLNPSIALGSSLLSCAPSREECCASVAVQQIATMTVTSSSGQEIMVGSGLKLSITAPIGSSSMDIIVATNPMSEEITRKKAVQGPGRNSKKKRCRSRPVNLFDERGSLGYCSGSAESRSTCGFRELRLPDRWTQWRVFSQGQLRAHLIVIRPIRKNLTQM
jgi:hypothetical protein